MFKDIISKEPQPFLKKILLVMFVAFSATAVIFSIIVLFTNFASTKPVDPAQSRGMFTVFAYRYIDELHPYESVPGTVWEITDINFKSDHLATVETFDGISLHTLEFIYVIESPNVRVLRINDVSANEAQDAQIALIRFLDLLRKENFEQAAVYYGGPISRIEPYGNAIDVPALGLEGYCKTVGSNGQCLLFNITESDRNLINGSYRFVVTYLKKDGTKFSTSGGKDEFTAIVENKNGKFMVITLPFD